MVLLCDAVWKNLTLEGKLAEAKFLLTQPVHCMWCLLTPHMIIFILLLKSTIILRYNSWEVERKKGERTIWETALYLILHKYHRLSLITFYWWMLLTSTGSTSTIFTYFTSFFTHSLLCVTFPCMTCFTENCLYLY
jgi:hypothetical protein